MTPMTPINVALPAQTMTVEALEALIAAAKAAVPKPFVPEVGQRVRFLEDNYGQSSWGRKGEECTVVRTHEYGCDVKLDNGRGKWATANRFLEPAPTPRYAVGDYAVYALDPDLTNWGVVEIREVVETGYRAKSMNPRFGIGTFCPEWLRPATEDEIAAATRIAPCYAKLLKRKSDGQVLRLWERCGDTTERTWWVDMVDSDQWAFRLAESAMTTRDYDVLASYLLKGA